MIENGFYILDKSYAELIKRFSGEFDDPKTRPIYCCIEDRNVKGLYWLIPTSDLSHRTPQQIQKYAELSQVRDIRQAYYHIGHTTKPAIFKISKVLPVTDKYISHEYKMQGCHLIMQDKKQIAEIKEKLQRILSYEALHPDRLEQKITTVKNFLCNELLQERHILPNPQNNCVNDKADELILENQIIREEYVRAYTDYLLGRVICCYDEEKLRDNRISVTRDCMIYRNYNENCKMLLFRSPKTAVFIITLKLLPHRKSR